MVIFILLGTTQIADAQDTDELLKQLCGKAEAPKRNAEQLAQAYEKAINYLMPLMSADDVGSRYQYQIALQDISSHASRPGAETERRTLASMLCRNIETAEMPATVRNWFVLQIERIGKDESVRTLTKLLSSEDGQLRDYARRALEKNPSELALQSLEQALEKTRDPACKIGLLYSLGQRPEPDVIGVLNPALQDKNPEVAAAAVSAMAECNSPQNVQILMDFLKKASDSSRIKAAQGLLDIAHKLARQQKFEQAAEIYDHLNDWAVEQEKDRDVFFIRTAALNGMAMCDGRRAVEVVTLAMRSDNPKVRSVAVKAARNAPTKDATRALTEMLSELDPYSQQQVLGLIADRGDLLSVKFVKEVLDSETESVRMEAIETLTRIGGDEAAEALLVIAIDDDGAAQKAAYAGLSVMIGPGVEEIIKARAASGDVNARGVAIGLLGERCMAGALESLLGYAADDNETINAAAFKALAAVADSDNIAILADLLTKTKNRGARENAVATLKSVLGKAADKDSAGQAMIEQMERSDADTRLAMLTTLSALGGSTALKTVTEAALSSDQALREAVERLLPGLVLVGVGPDRIPRPMAAEHVGVREGLVEPLPPAPAPDVEPELVIDRAVAHQEGIGWCKEHRARHLGAPATDILGSHNAFLDQLHVLRSKCSVGILEPTRDDPAKTARRIDQICSDSPSITIVVEAKAWL